MSGIVEFIRGLFSSESAQVTADPERVLRGTDDEPGVVARRDELTDWHRAYADD